MDKEESIKKLSRHKNNNIKKVSVPEETDQTNHQNNHNSNINTSEAPPAHLSWIDMWYQICVRNKGITNINKKYDSLLYMVTNHKIRRDDCNGNEYLLLLYYYANNKSLIKFIENKYLEFNLQIFECNKNSDSGNDGTLVVSKLLLNDPSKWKPND